MPLTPIRRQPLLYSLIFFTALAVGPRASAEVNSPAHLAETALSRAAKPEVVIYYSNETSPDQRESQNYETITHWLSSSGEAPALKVVGQLTRDLREFPMAVDQETDALTHSRGADPRAVIIFTNRLVRSGKFLVKETGPAKDTAIPPPKFISYILTSNPLASPETLQLALTETAKLFDPKLFDFVLITKSHGTSKLALTPRLAVRAEETNQQQLLALLRDENGNHEDVPWIRNRLGIPKEELFSILNNAGKKDGMFFRLVFLESCSSELSQSDTPQTAIQMPTNVASLVTTHGETPYRTVDYASLLKDPAHEAFSAKLEKQLSALSQESKTQRKGSSMWRFLYYLPLAALGVYFLLTQSLFKRPASAYPDS